MGRRKKVEVRNSTIHNYLKNINTWILPQLGDLEVDNITRKNLQSFITEFASTHKQNTVINITKPISGSLKWAEENGYIDSSPWKNIKIPKDFSEKEIEVFTKDEISLLLEAKHYQQIKKDMIILGYRTGMRIGEILTLRWEDINFNDRFLTVKRTLSGYENNTPEITEPKTRKSRRRIDLDEITLKMLNDRKGVKEGYVFCKKDGSVYSRQAINLPRMCKSVGIEPRSFHALRHTHATVLLAAGVNPKIVQERLGHAKITTTLDTYSHLIPGMQHVAVDVFNRMGK